MYIKPLFLTFILTMALPMVSFPQAKKRKLPATINRLTIKNHAPFISGDGNTLLYLCDYNNEREFTLRYTSKISMSSWKEAKDVSRIANNPKIAYQGGYSLNFDGSILYYTFRKHPGVGGYDIWYSTKEGEGWSEPKNDGKPLNTSAHEGAPSVSADGRYLYFMRCGQMSFGSASDCKLYVSERRGRSWSEGKPLPAHINQGNTMMPRILADGETLIFSSDRPGGKGGLDFYQTRKEGDTWSEPVPLAFINTAKDDLYISIPSKGRYLYHTVDDGRGGAFIEELLIPDAFKPRKVMRVQGQATTGESPVSAKVKAYTIDTRQRVWDDATGSDGEFILVMQEGKMYDFSVEPKEKGYAYFSKIYDLQQMKYSQRDELQVNLPPLNKGVELTLENILFQAHSAELSDASTYELRRLTRMIKNNPDLRFELGLYLSGYRQDSLQNDPDLTEVLTDTIYQETSETTYQGEGEGSMSENRMEEEAASEGLYSLEHTYHNDRSQKQAENLMAYLKKKGIPEERISLQTYRTTAPEEGGEAKTKVKVKVL